MIEVKATETPTTFFGIRKPNVAPIMMIIAQLINQPQNAAWLQYLNSTRFFPAGMYIAWAAPLDRYTGTSLPFSPAPQFPV